MPNYRGLAFPAPERQHSVTFIPLAGMLEAGLRAATSIGEYDSARALTNEKLKEVRAPPYSRPGAAADSAVERYAPPGPPDVTEGDLNVSVRTAFVDENLSGPADSPPTGQMRMEVLVTWDAGSYSTVGVVSGEPL